MHFIFNSGPHYNQLQTIMFELMNAVNNQRCLDESLLKRLFCPMCAHADSILHSREFSHQKQPSADVHAMQAKDLFHSVDSFSDYNVSFLKVLKRVVDLSQ